MLSKEQQSRSSQGKLWTNCMHRGVFSLQITRSKKNTLQTQADGQPLVLRIFLFILHRTTFYHLLL